METQQQQPLIANRPAGWLHPHPHLASGLGARVAADRQSIDEGLESLTTKTTQGPALPTPVTKQRCSATRTRWQWPARRGL